MREFVLGLAAMGVLWALLHCYGCAPHHPPPTPAPVPSPTPSPMPTPIVSDYPLGVSGSRFVDVHGEAWWPIGVEFCCTDSKVYDWPLVNRKGLELAAAHGANIIHVRIGPTVRLENRVGKNFDAYRYVAALDRWDVRTFNEPYFDWLHDIVETANRLPRPIVVEVDLIDGWGPRQDARMRRLGKPPLSPWARENNINGVDAGSCAIFQRAPQPVHLALVGKIVDSVGDLPNAIWHEGNEVSLCGGTNRAWIDGIEREVRIAEAQNGFARHLYGSNALEPDVLRSPAVQYVTTHNFDHVGSVLGKPTWTNEYRDCQQPMVWEAQARRNRKAWSGFVFWRGECSDDVFAEMLLRMAAIQNKEFTQ